MFLTALSHHLRHQVSYSYRPISCLMFHHRSINYNSNYTNIPLYSSYHANKFHLPASSSIPLHQSNSPLDVRLITSCAKLPNHKFSQIHDHKKLLGPSFHHNCSPVIKFSNGGHILSKLKTSKYSSICDPEFQISSRSVLHTQTDGSTEYTKNSFNLPKRILDASPAAVQPYLQMVRFDRPIGTWLLYWPCTWSIALAAQPGCWPDFYMLALFGAGAFFMRGSGCIINDMWDRDFDNKVERTRDRPLASGKVSYPQAMVFLSSQLAISLAILLQLNWYSIGLGAASLIIVVSYPTFKRFTYWPQVVLGFAFNYGALLGWAAVRGSCDWSIVLPLYFLCHMWTMIYDTVYAHQDKADDLMIGVKSTALRFGDQTKPWLAGFTTLMAGGLLYVGHLTDMTWPYYTGATLTIANICLQLYRLDINNPQACGDAFRFHFYMGLLMFVSIMLGNLAKPKDSDDRENEKKEQPAMVLL